MSPFAGDVDSNGNADDTDACTAACHTATCGDGFVQPDNLGEQCDKGPGNSDTAYGDDSCTTSCQLGPRCGDGVLQDERSEQCDDGTPDGDDLCNDCVDVPRLHVFVTTDAYTGQFGGASGADSVCTVLAGQSDVGAPGADFTAWISDPSSAVASRYGSTNFTGWYVLPTAPPTLVARGWAGLTSGSLMNPIDATETGVTVPAPTTTWTSTAPDGALNDLNDHCNGWTGELNTQFGRLGEIFATNNQWTQKLAPMTSTCDNTHHIYCVEN